MTGDEVEVRASMTVAVCSTWRGLWYNIKHQCEDSSERAHPDALTNGPTSDSNESSLTEVCFQTNW